MGQFDWMQRTQRQPRPATNQPAANTTNMNSYLQSGHLPGVGGGGNQNAEMAQIYGNMGAANQQNMGDYQKYMQGLMGQNNVSAFQNPYVGQTNAALSNMANAPTTMQSSNSWLNQFLPMMQNGGQMSFSNPQLQQTQLGQGVTNFMNQPSTANNYAAPSLGAGGDVMSRIMQMQQPQGGGNAQGQAAGNQWMQGLTGLLNQPGMSPEQMDMAARGIIDPTSRAIGKKQESDLSGLSNRGLGRSTAVNQLMGENAGILGDITSRAYGDLTQQNIGLQNNNRLAALSGLGQAQGQFTGQDQNQQGMTQNWLMNQAGVGGQLAGLTQGGQLATNQLNQGASNDAFNQGATRAGMGMDLYNPDANRALSLLNSNRNYDTTTQGMMADNQFRNANMGNQNIMSLLGMGAGAGQQDFGNQQALLQGLLGASGQAQSAWGSNQNNLLQQLGMRGDMANSLFGNQSNQFNNDRNFWEQMRQYGQNRQDQLNAQQGGGLGGMLGGIGGTLLGSALRPLGAGIGGQIGSSLFGGGQQQQRRWY